ncbi:flavodoxin family protein [Halomonas sp.]|uniref:flavodoxin family protein n=1 Tax=Halomonas sp. TaxID=1486246 RepID=UPI003F8DCDCD
MKVVVIFHSVTGTTKKLAHSIASGAAMEPGVEVVAVEIVGADIVEGRFRNIELLRQLDNADAIIFGSPTYMGCVSAQFKAFTDATSEWWARQAWANKIAAGFTIGANLSGDQLSTIQYLQVFASQHGMFWVGLDTPGNYDPAMRNRLGAQSGLIAHSVDTDLNETDLLTARYLGQRVVQTAQKLAA